MGGSGTESGSRGRGTGEQGSCTARVAAWAGEGQDALKHWPGTGSPCLKRAWVWAEAPRASSGGGQVPVSDPPGVKAGQHRAPGGLCAGSRLFCSRNGPALVMTGG